MFSLVLFRFIVLLFPTILEITKKERNIYFKIVGLRTEHGFNYYKLTMILHDCVKQ